MVRPGIREYFRLRPREPHGITGQVDEEIDLHIELRTQELIARGADPEQARQEAELRFGELRRARLDLHRMAQERDRTMSMGEWLAGWRQDFAYSARSLAREPLVAVMVVLTLALGIGANATIFGIVDQLLLRGPAHVVSPETLRRVYVTQTGWTGGLVTSSSTGYVTASIMRDLPDLFDDVAVYSYSQAMVGTGEASRPEHVGRSTANLFPLLGVRPALGRFFTEAEDRPGAAEHVVVLEHGYWQQHFGGTPEALGRTLLLDGESYTVIGVAPRGFTGPERTPARFWVPFSAGMHPRADWETTWRARWAQVITRVRPGVPPEQADARATAAYRAAAAAAGQQEAAEADVKLLPTGFTAAGKEPAEAAVSRWLGGVSLVVLLVACANVVNLLLARGVRRRREVAVRLALGVSRRRLVRLLLSESLLLAVAGGALALALAAAGSGPLRGALLPEMIWDTPLNTRVLLFSGILALVTGLLVGLVPALQSAGQDVTVMLKAGVREGGPARGRLRGGLIVLQTAFALVLLVGASHFVRSLWNVHTMDLGIQADNVLSVWASFPGLDDLPPEQRQAQQAREQSFSRDAVERLRGRGDVAAATVAGSPPMSGALMTLSLSVPGRDSLPTLPGGGPYGTAVSDGYFETVGTPILRGRGIEAGDRAGGEPVVVVNETMARTLWPGQDALGHCFHIGGSTAPCFRIVGIAQDAQRRALVEEPAMQYYVPIGRSGLGGDQILVRPVGRTQAFIPELRSSLYSMDPRLGYVHITRLSDTLDDEVRPWRLGATMFLVFGGLALLIAAIGLYSVVAYGVAQRRAELGVRLALGARSSAIVALVLRQGVALVLLGVAIGVPIALLAGRMLEPLLFQTRTGHPGTLGAVALLLLLVAALASAVPAARAGRTDPLEALRTD
jgi:predicted permease